MSLLLLGSLTACTDAGDEPQPKKQQATSARVEYQLSVSQDLLDAATVTVYYIGDDGRQAQENLSQTSWTKTVNIATLPSQAGFSLQPRLKGEPSKEEYTIGASGKMTVTVLDQEGRTFAEPFVGLAPALQAVLDSEYLGQYFTHLALHIQQAKAIDQEGTISDATIDWGGNDAEDDPDRDTEISNDGATGDTRSGAI